jgi:hypothetical protein
MCLCGRIESSNWSHCEGVRALALHAVRKSTDLESKMFGKAFKKSFYFLSKLKKVAFEVESSCNPTSIFML